VELRKFGGDIGDWFHFGNRMVRDFGRDFTSQRAHYAFTSLKRENNIRFIK